MANLNRTVAECFSEIADLLELLGENPFKIRAYRRGAEAVLALDEPVNEAIEANRSVPGLGEALKAKALEYAATGRMEYLERLRDEVPPAIIGLTQVPGIGAKTAWKLYNALGVEDPASLLAAARSGLIRKVPGFGERTEENIIRALTMHASAQARRPLYTVLPAVERIVQELRRVDGVTAVSPGGSVRRRCETIGDIDIVAASTDPKRLLDAFVGLDEFQEVLSRGSVRASALTRDGVQCDIWVVEPGQFATALHHVTGSKEHHVALRGIAGRMGLKISEYGVTRDSDGAVLPVHSEEDLYALLGMDYVPPELRENRGEIDAALAHELPMLIEASHIRGDLHMHSNWSDGTLSIAQMARAARDMGYEYIAITDHSRSLAIARGLSEERFLQQLEEIQRARREVPGIHILAGSEVDILRDGSLDFDDSLLERADIVIASIHSGFKQDKETITSRIIKAMRNPNVDIVAHPTGRLLGRRPGYAVDIEAVIREAKATNTALEINSYPERMDLSDVNARAAMEAGVMVAINTDSHAAEELENIKFGIWTARRAWLGPRNVLNARPLDELLSWLRNRE
ncbi:MAG: DNA polymerase/3'-5' exonuclease PolX [Firmicutes bacterium]|jgi:DNA polymerase (family 10)|nr:DNA polymerase/3'-5' exonuclease PolX [Bacillota bacterium]